MGMTVVHNQLTNQFTVPLLQVVLEDVTGHPGLGIANVSEKILHASKASW